MIRTLAVTTDHEILTDVPLNSLDDERIAWYWVDFHQSNEKEALLLKSHFHFHPLAIEDCLHFLQRPKVEYYGNHNFLVIHSIHPETLELREVDVFIGENYVVSFHFDDLSEINAAWDFFSHDPNPVETSPMEVVYKIMDKLVDTYFPIVHDIEDRLDEIEKKSKNQSLDALIKEVFEIRSDLLQLRHSVVPMRDLLYRILESKRFIIQDEKRAYFQDIYDHLIKLADMVDSNREVTADFRDSYISLTSYRMNSIMKTLTVITTIFMPLTFIAGVYGMNFKNMPELNWHYGYFIILGVMLIIGFLMYAWFKAKGWFGKD
ncbi:magnesium/cobalt transporter CorA [Fictibacillus gelatini]|uniref:magnesium/cobalt transporter CorA n=1 Tax=Fictibacillus gelatini TaxID=225985 RepID=UPI00041BC88D|nr:magnesium/cobalt transporter CorA [Fictibacillus gelatini]